jgi:hypothetical protein
MLMLKAALYTKRRDRYRYRNGSPAKRGKTPHTISKQHPVMVLGRTATERFWCLWLILGGLQCILSLTAIFAQSAADLQNPGPASEDRSEPIGPLYCFEQKLSTRIWASPPVFSYTLDEETDFEEFDFVYPLLTYDRFGPNYRFQILQLFNFAGGEALTGTNVHRFTLFPFYFQQRSAMPEKNYTALVPIYGRFKNRFFRDEARFIVWPIYVQSRKRDVITDNYVYPFFHLRRGDGLSGWQFWPLVGAEHKEVTFKTNIWEEVETISGHDKFFAPWPIYFNQKTGIGTTNAASLRAVLPLFSVMRSPLRDSTTAPWPLGVTYTVDREKNYTEWGTPWPFIVFARGTNRNINRVWPLYSRARTDTLESTFYLWPVYKCNRITSEPLDRRRTRILLFLYSDVVEKNTETGGSSRRADFWPLFTARRDFEGNKSLQILALLEPILPNNKSIQRNYSPLWSLWRSQANGKTGATRQSFLWNLYRREADSETKKLSLLFGLFKYQSTPHGTQWRLFYVPLGRKGPSAPSEPATR